MAVRSQTLEQRDAVVGELIRYISGHLKEPLSESGLAEMVCFSQSYCCRAFLAVMGETLGEFIRRVRLERAAILLAQGCSLSEVAMAVGYGGADALIRAFFRRFDCTPSRFRELNEGRAIQFPSYRTINGTEPGSQYEEGVYTAFGAITTFVYDHVRLGEWRDRQRHG